MSQTRDRVRIRSNPSHMGPISMASPTGTMRSIPGSRLRVANDASSSLGSPNRSGSDTCWSPWRLRRATGGSPTHKSTRCGGAGFDCRKGLAQLQPDQAIVLPLESNRRIKFDGVAAGLGELSTRLWRRSHSGGRSAFARRSRSGCPLPRPRPRRPPRPPGAGRNRRSDP